MYAKKNNGKKLVVLLLAVVLLIGCTIGGTVAWLVAQTDPVTNTFVVGDIGMLSLTETDDDGGADHKYTITPGVNIAKNPVVTYTPADTTNNTTNVPVYVFVKVDVNNNWTVNGKSYSAADKKISWAVADDWASVSGTTGVFCIAVDSATDVTSKSIMQTIGETKQTIAVSSEITKNDVNSIATSIGSITFTAYAIQKEGHADVAAAWAAVNPSNS